MKIYTRGGDEGKTSLYTGERVEKNHPQIIALGELDELTSQLGIVRSKVKDLYIKKQIQLIQKLLVDLMGVVAGLVDYKVVENIGIQVKNIEKLIDVYSTQIPDSFEFILPGDSEISCEIHLARTIARKAERKITVIEKLPLEIRSFINRLSDYLYTIAKYVDIMDVMKMDVSKDYISRKDANKIIENVMEYAKFNDCNVVVAILSKEGTPISVQAMENAFLISYELAIKKAYTAASLQMPTHKLAKLTKKGEEFEGLESMIDGNKVITLGGGYPIKINNSILGSIGVSGGTEKQDIDFARYGALTFEGE